MLAISNAMRRLRRWIHVPIIVIGSLSVITCGGDTPSTPDDDPGGQERILTISLDETTGAPGGRIKIDGVPADVEWAYGLVTVPGSAQTSADGHAAAEGRVAAPDEFGIAFIRRSESGDELVVPLHPTSPMNGGTVEIEITNGSTITSNRVTLDIDAIPKAPGAFNEIVTKTETLLDGWIAHQGTTAEALRSVTADQLSLLHLPLLLFHGIINHPDNPSSLRAFADGDIPLMEGDEADELDRELLDAVAARSGLSGFLDEMIGFVDTLTAPDLAVRAPTASDLRPASNGVPCFEGPSFDIGENDCFKLAEVMKYRAQVEFDQNSATKQISDDVADTIFSVMGYTRGVFIAWGLANTFWASDQIASGSQGVYPSEFLHDRTDFIPDPEVFPEDFDDPGRWSEFKVTAKSSGWRFDTVLEDALGKAKGAKSAFDRKTLDGLVKKQSEGASVRKIESKMKGAAKNAVWDKAKDDLGIDEMRTLEYCEELWVNIDCTGKPYSEASSPSLDVDEDALTYEPKEVGSTTLEVKTSSLFGLAGGTAETKTIETKRIQVIIDPFQASASTDEPVDFTVRVENAVDPTIEWYATGPLPKNLTTGPTNATVHTPDDPWNPAIVIHARSLSMTGLRKNVTNTDVREDSTEITFGDGIVIVEPASICLASGDTLTFTAALVPGDIDTIEWRIEPEGAGSITQGGKYTAPAAPLSEPVLVIATVNGSLEGGALVAVGSCDCYWTALVTGHVGATLSGTIAIASGFSLLFDDADGTVFQVIPQSEITGIGEWDVGMSYFHGSGGDVYAAALADESEWPTLEIEEFVADEYMKGFIKGELQQFDQPGPPATWKRVDVLLHFKAQIYDGVEPLCGEL